VGAEPGPAREELDNGGKLPACLVAVGGWESMADEMMKTLILLEERARIIRARLEQIKVRMRELRIEDEEGRRALAGAIPRKIRPKPGLAMMWYTCKMGRAILMLGILGILTPVESTGTGGKKLAYDGLQGLLESVAMGIAEKQLEMREMDKNMSIKKMELADCAEETAAAGPDIQGNRGGHAQVGEGEGENRGGEGPTGGASQLH
jgi:hypothetical protein